MMRKARRILVGIVATLVLTGMVIAVPASAQRGDSPIASQSKKKCKKGFVKRKKKCVKRSLPGTAPGAAVSQGRYTGHYSENATELRFNVVGSRLYTGAFDSFFIYADCGGGYFDPSAIAPVEASIAGNGAFAGSGVYSPGFGVQVPWQISGHIAGGSVTSGIFSAGPYTDTFGDTCTGTTHFTAQWFAGYTL